MLSVRKTEVTAVPHQNGFGVVLWADTILYQVKEYMRIKIYFKMLGCKEKTTALKQKRLSEDGRADGEKPGETKDIRRRDE